MPQQPDAKTCKMCGMEIPVVARKCPYCHHWQRWLSLQNPRVVVLFVFVPLIILYGAMMGTFVHRPFREWEQFSKHSSEVKITESKMTFGEEQCGPVVVIVGKLDNRSSVAWKDVRFQVEFFNQKGQFFDTGQQEVYTWRLPAGQETPFKVSFHRHFPEKEYASHKVCVVSAVDSRQWP